MRRTDFEKRKKAVYTNTEKKRGKICISSQPVYSLGLRYIRRAITGPRRPFLASSDPQSEKVDDSFRWKILRVRNQKEMCQRTKQICSAPLALLWAISCIQPSRSFHAGLRTGFACRSHPLPTHNRRIPATTVHSPPSVRISHIRMQDGPRPGGEDIAKSWQDKRTALTSAWSDHRSVRAHNKTAHAHINVHATTSAPASCTRCSSKKNHGI
jgi:hypothetical protein